MLQLGQAGRARFACPLTLTTHARPPGCLQNPEIQRMTQAIAQDPVFMEMAREMQESMLGAGMGNLNLNEEEGAAAEGAAPRAPGIPPGMPNIDPAKYMQVRRRTGGGCRAGWGARGRLLEH